MTIMFFLLISSQMERLLASYFLKLVRMVVRLLTPEAACRSLEFAHRIRGLTPCMVYLCQEGVPMKRGASAEHTRLEIIRLCHSTLDSRTLRVEVLKRLQTVIPFDCTFFSTTDPATLLFTSSLLDFTLPTWARLRLIENEYVQDDFNKFLDLLKNHLPVGVLSEQTQDELPRSQRYRDILTPLSLGDEMRATFVTNAACWGTLCLHL